MKTQFIEIKVIERSYPIYVEYQHEETGNRFSLPIIRVLPVTDQLVRSKEEILDELDETYYVEEIATVSYETALKAMEIYRNQPNLPTILESHQQPGQETCKWQHGEYPDCMPFGEHFVIHPAVTMVYCPFCGKLIERV
jgi:hypothetical protein